VRVLAASGSLGDPGFLQGRADPIPDITSWALSGMAAAPEAAPAQPGHRTRNPAVVLVVMVFAMIIVLACVYASPSSQSTAPIPHLFSERFVSRSNEISAPSGSRVSGWWETVDGSFVTFLIIMNLTSYAPTYWSNGSGGTFSFTATGSSLIFEEAPVPCPLDCQASPIQVAGEVW
jgi:hypothetical protein